MPTVEERLAALEKQMAAWMDQRPTTYYTHQYSGEEIDAAVGRAATGGALDTSVTNVSNQLGTFVRPNLLDNWYFGRPVNQSGHAEYKGDWAYTIDRWQIANGSMEIDNGVTISGDYVFEPLLDIVDSIRGKLVTASILLANNELRYATATIPATWGGWDAIVGGNNGFSLRGVGETSEQLWFVISDKSKVVAAKLELGPTQTLAHQENGVWVLNEVPDYGEQLRRCQWYSNLLPGIYWLPQNADGTNRLTIPIPEMRTIPVVTYEPADGSTGTLYYDANLAQKNSIQFYAIGVTGICGVKNIRISADL